LPIRSATAEANGKFVIKYLVDEVFGYYFLIERSPKPYRFRRFLRRKINPSANGLARSF
jgi:hypothetical protein